ncbi:MAG: GNAT family N-acetyltransferase [Microthrixaceae bacterium]
MDLHALVNEWWADVFDVSVSELLRPGVQIAVDPPGLSGYRGIYMLRLDNSCIVGTPADLADRVRDSLDGRDAADDVFNRSTAATFRPAGSARVSGPSWHGYLAREDAPMTSPTEVRRLDQADGRIMDDLRRLVGDDEWAEGGFVPIPDVLWGIEDDEGLAAAGNMTDFRGQAADVGLATRPNARGRGLATAVAKAMCCFAPAEVDILRYRALEGNLASLRVAQGLGFTGHGSNIAVRIEG